MSLDGGYGAKNIYCFIQCVTCVGTVLALVKAVGEQDADCYLWLWKFGKHLGDENETQPIA